MVRPEKQTNKTKNRTRYRYQYTVNFNCTVNEPGTLLATDAFVPGEYTTAVNIHNPREKQVKLRKKLASPVKISKFLETGLKSDEVERVPYGQIEKFGSFLIHGFEGFLVIESTPRLDVVALYIPTNKDDFVMSIDVENVKGRKI